ncbi:hypothetical protein [Actinomadura litoris]|uniref:Uncharacterized protein n=1 Tax=Actinomadura litoris TaxID=2678616 RepID=A0A7K1L2R6_9ACTN|nr:hypothetical protein [Actinomadura litoris]MUN38738.1 hypothetical protein [Actinomadura litoris]
MNAPRIVVDPDLPEDVRTLLTEWENAKVKLYDLRDLRPLSEGEDKRLPLVSGKTMATVAGGVALDVLLTLTIGWGLVGFLLLFIVPMLVGAGMVLWGLTPRYWRDQKLTLRRAHGRYVLATDLDEESRTLLARTHRAISTVLRSQVHADGTLDHIRNEVVLPRMEWEIASALRGVSELRRRHPELRQSSANDAGRTLAATLTALRQRIAALEEYAEQTKKADAAALLPGDHAAADLDALTAQARAATAN